MLARIKTYLFGGLSGEPVRVIVIGLDAAGKTTYLYKSRTEVITTIPTIGFNVETARIKKAELTCWDVGGCDKIRPLWRHYTEGSVAVVMFVDSNDRDRMYDAKRELDIFLNDRTMVAVPLLVVANKQDLPRAATVQEVVDYLSLRAIVGHDWYIIPASVASGQGVAEINSWIQTVAREGRPLKAQTSETAVPSPNLSGEDASTEATSGHLIHVKPVVPATHPVSSMLDTPAVPEPPPPPNSDDVRQDWMVRPDLPEAEFLFLLDTFQLDIWDHYTHVRIAWALLNKHGIEQGFLAVEEALRRFIEHSSRTDHRSFHATMTRFWCHMIAYAMKRFEKDTTSEHVKDVDAGLSDFKRFIVAVCTKNSSLGVAAPLWDKVLFKKFYTTSAMFKDKARAAPSPPDLLSLPDIIPFLQDATAPSDFEFMSKAVYWAKV